jgi:hypothetical protein
MMLRLSMTTSCTIISGTAQWDFSEIGPWTSGKGKEYMELAFAEKLSEHRVAQELNEKQESYDS